VVRVGRGVGGAKKRPKGLLGNFGWGRGLAVGRGPPPPPPHVSKRSAASAPQTVLLRTQDYTHPDDHTSPPYDMTPGFKPFTMRPIFI